MSRHEIGNDAGVHDIGVAEAEAVGCWCDGRAAIGDRRAETDVAIGAVTGALDRARARVGAGGEIHTAGASVAEVRLTLVDGTQLTDDVQADVALF